MREGQELIDAVRQMYENNKHLEKVDPELLANGAMVIIGFRREVHPIGWLGCNLHCRQIARAFCRRNFDPEGLAESGDLFPDMLQDRYPRFRLKGEDPEYVLRSELNVSDRWFNIDRMRHTALALRSHANTLEKETVRLFGPRPSAA